MEKLLTGRNTAFVVGALIVWRLYLSATLQLHPDEAYYWLWSRNLDIGYFDHPPLVAYFIWLTTLVSKSELFVRLSGTLVALALSGIIWRLALQLFNNNVQVAAGSVILFNLLPLTTMGLVVITPDTPVLLFWSLGIYLFWQTLHSDRHWLWYAVGVVFGMALLSKYTAILMLPSVLLYLTLTDDKRWLKTTYPYRAVLIGFLCFLPVVYWNSQHDWVSFTFQLKNGLSGEGYSLGKVAEYVGGQLLVAGPIVWVVGMWAAVVGLYRKDKESLLLVCAALPVIAFFAFSSLKKPAAPNWPAFAYVTLCILIAKYCLGVASSKRRWLWCAAAVSSLALSALTSLHARFNVIPLDRYSKALVATDATNFFYGWRELATELSKYPGQPFAVTPSHQLSAEIIYYSDANVLANTASMARPSQFNLWKWSKDLPRKDGLYVWTDSDFIGHNGDYFASPARSDLVNIVRDGHVVRKLHFTSGDRTSSLAHPFSAN
ncbi:MAG: glycosyltransferase family 39 protein [Pseudomonadota bacterium]